MSSRDIRARIDRLAKVIGEQGQKVPTCRFHGKACEMGRRWPLPFPEDHESALLDWLRELKEHRGEELEPHPRDVWRTDAHEVVPQAELDERERETQALLARLRADNDQAEAQLRAGLDVGYLDVGYGGGS